MAVAHDFEITIAFMGEGAVGKSAITLRYLGQGFTNEYDPTIEDFYTVNRRCREKNFHVHILDTAGQEELTQVLTESWIRNADAFVLVFDLTNLTSLNTVRKFQNQIIDQKMRGGAAGRDSAASSKTIPPPIIMIGNKSDLVEDRKIPQNLAEEKAQEWDLQYFEASALLNTDSIAESFNDILAEYMNLRLRPSEVPVHAHGCSCTLL